MVACRKTSSGEQKRRDAFAEMQSQNPNLVYFKCTYIHMQISVYIMSQNVSLSSFSHIKLLMQLSWHGNLIRLFISCRRLTQLLSSMACRSKFKKLSTLKPYNFFRASICSHFEFGFMLLLLLLWRREMQKLLMKWVFVRDSRELFLRKLLCFFASLLLSESAPLSLF